MSSKATKSTKKMFLTDCRNFISHEAKKAPSKYFQIYSFVFFASLREIYAAVIFVFLSPIC